MEKIELAPDFKEFLQLLNSEKVEYLLIGGYAVGMYGYPRATGDLDLWVAAHPENAKRILAALEKFGFGGLGATPDLLLEPKKVIRMGEPPVRIELLTQISGVAFEECFARREIVTIEDISVNVISLPDLKINKRASGRGKDLLDLEQLD